MSTSTGPDNEGRASAPETGADRTAARAAPVVSVIIPTFNRARFVVEAIESVLAQTFAALEVIVIDDGSTDETARVLAPYGERIRYLRTENRGISAARNTGMRAARGQYIAWLDDDDLWLPEKIAIQVEVLARYPAAVLVSTDFSAFDNAGEIEASHMATYYSAVGHSRRGLAGLYPRSDWLDLSAATGGVRARLYHGEVRAPLVWGNFVHPPTILFRRSLFERLGGLDESLGNASNEMEHEFFLRASRIGEFACVDRPLLRYRYHGDGQASSDANLVGMKLGALEILGRIARDDPAFVRTHARRFRRRQGECELGVAWACAETDRAMALRYLGRSLRRGVWSLEWLKVLAKAVLPRALVQRIRRQRARRRRTSGLRM
jgi:glycosyltransferase involved in cell wall biosynthesis